VPFCRICPTANELSSIATSGPAAERPVGDPLHQQPDDHGPDDHDHQRRFQWESGAETEDRQVGRDHHHVAVGEVDQAQDPEDHRQPDGHQRVQAAGAQGVDDLLDDVVGHAVTPPTPR
jgi:hypothetical protein